VRTRETRERRERREINRKSNIDDWVGRDIGKFDKIYTLLCKIICIKYKYK
jgi:hypothetical protein